MAMNTMERLLQVASPAPDLSGAPGNLETDDSFELVPVHRLAPDPQNVRKTMKNVRDLTESVKDIGVLQPIIARRNKNEQLVIVMGHRRLAAAKRAGLKAVPVVIKSKPLSRVEILKAQIMENSHHETMDPIDEAHAIRKYMHEAKVATYEQAGEALGHSMGWVGNRLSLLDLSKEDQKLVSNGKLSIQKAAAKSRRMRGNTRALRVEPDSSKAYFGQHHVLAKAAALSCAKHKERKITGSVACGECWETVIRKHEADKRTSNVSFMTPNLAASGA